MARSVSIGNSFAKAIIDDSTCTGAGTEQSFIAMSETLFSAKVADGEAPAKLFLPTEITAKSLPLVVMYADAFGLRPELSTLGEQLASAGYAVVQPDPFWRLQPYAPFDPKTAFRIAEEKERLFALLAKASFDATLADTKALVALLANDPRIATNKIAAMGYCMGGRFSLLSAIHWPEKIVAIASMHGGGLVTPKPNSPHLALASVHASMYFAVADNDGSCTPEMQQTLKQALEQAKITYELEVFPGALHGFGVPGTGVYDASAQERSWKKMLALFATSFVS